MVLFTHDQNINYLQPNILDNIAHEETIYCWQLFAGHACGWPLANEQSIFVMELKKSKVKTSCRINMSNKHISDVTETTKLNF